MFDFDREGFEKFKKARDLRFDSRKVYGAKEGSIRTGLYIKHTELNKYALLLPIPERLENYVSEETSSDCFIEVETLISEDYLKTNPKAKQRSRVLAFYQMKDKYKSDFWKDLLGVDKKYFVDFKLLFAQIENLLNV